jgi:hypothetical protein
MMGFISLFSDTSAVFHGGVCWIACLGKSGEGGRAEEVRVELKRDVS